MGLSDDLGSRILLHHAAPPQHLGVLRTPPLQGDGVEEPYLFLKPLGLEAMHTTSNLFHWW